MISGSCACGKIQYEVRSGLKDFSHCHCSLCRKLHGAAFASWGGVERRNFAILSGEDSLKTYAFSEKADSMFCANCGSRMYSIYKPEQDTLYLALGTVDGELDCPAGLHEFVDSKADWFNITDDLPKYPQARDD